MCTYFYAAKKRTRRESKAQKQQQKISAPAAAQLVYEINSYTILSWRVSLQENGCVHEKKVTRNSEKSSLPEKSKQCKKKNTFTDKVKPKVLIL